MYDMYEQDGQLAREYARINSSFRKSLVFKIGDDAGFFSEYNNMLLAMLYCLENKLQFVLSSKDANFALSKGWQDYFQPFCVENHSRLLSRYNHRVKRYYSLTIRSPLKRLGLVKSVQTPYPWYFPILFKFHRAPLLTHDVFEAVRALDLHKLYSYPTLHINGDLQHAVGQLSLLTWRFSPPTRSAVVNRIQSLCLPDSYIGMHIRKGDKCIEHKLYEVCDYFNALSDSVRPRDVFVLTDDYSVIEEIRRDYPSWNVYTFCKENDLGYQNGSFYSQSKTYIHTRIVELFASIQILQASQLYIGTYSSNPGMFIGSRIPKDRFVGLDAENWIIC